MRHNGSLGRWHTQVCYWVSFLDVQNIVFQDNLKSKLRHAELLQCARDLEWRQVYTLPRAPLGRIVNDVYFSPDNVFSIGCI